MFLECAAVCCSEWVGWQKSCFKPTHSSKLPATEIAIHSPKAKNTLGKFAWWLLSSQETLKARVSWFDATFHLVDSFVRVQSTVKSNNYRVVSERLKALCQLALLACNKSAFRLSSVQLTLDNYSSRRGQWARLFPCMQVWQLLCWLCVSHCSKDREFGCYGHPSGQVG